MKIRRSSFSALFVVALLTTEFFYIEVGGGVARIYHFLALTLVLTKLSTVPRLLGSKVFLALLVFALINMSAVLLSDAPQAALLSLLGNFANLGMAAVVAILLLHGRLSVEQLSKLVLVVTVISVCWGLIQSLAFESGILLALSPEQEPQIAIGFGPAFRTEANTFGKYMLFPVLFFLPTFLHNSGNRRLRLAYLIMVIGLLMNFTRTAVIGVLVALVFALIWYASKGQLQRATKRFGAIIFTVAIGVALMLSGALSDKGYAQHKLENFFNQDEVLQGESSAYRLLAMQTVLQNALGNDKRMVIGNGWGQTYYEVAGQKVQSGGGDAINVLGYSGFIGVAAYLFYTFSALAAAFRLARRRDSTSQTLFAEGVLFALVGMFVTAQMSGYLIAPEYYLLLGVCIYFSFVPKNGGVLSAKQS